MHLVESNFREIYHALKYPGEQQFPLVANLSGTRIYDSRYCWGRIWRWFYQLTAWTTGSRHLQESALKLAILRTHSLFHQEMAKVQLPLKSYLDYLHVCAKGYIVREGTFFPARSLITNWNASTKP
ncbi:MAG TPA: hypothetical protein VGP47_06585, partial [Parachlamydiaceae bacterium]|nr:hypothetical protein [Parachlamydiaceae bacterium]